MNKLFYPGGNYRFPKKNHLFRLYMYFYKNRGEGENKYKMTRKALSGGDIGENQFNTNGLKLISALNLMKEQGDKILYLSEISELILEILLSDNDKTESIEAGSLKINGLVIDSDQRIWNWCELKKTDIVTKPPELSSINHNDKEKYCSLREILKNLDNKQITKPCQNCLKARLYLFFVFMRYQWFKTAVSSLMEYHFILENDFKDDYTIQQDWRPYFGVNLYKNGFLDKDNIQEVVNARSILYREPLILLEHLGIIKHISVFQKTNTINGTSYNTRTIEGNQGEDFIDYELLEEFLNNLSCFYQEIDPGEIPDTYEKIKIIRGGYQLEKENLTGVQKKITEILEDNKGRSIKTKSLVNKLKEINYEKEEIENALIELEDSNFLIIQEGWGSEEDLYPIKGRYSEKIIKAFELTG